MNLCRIQIHKYLTVRRGGAAKYQRCQRCGYRRIIQSGIRFYPHDSLESRMIGTIFGAYRAKAPVVIDWHWLDTGSWSPMAARVDHDEKIDMPSGSYDQQYLEESQRNP